MLQAVRRCRRWASAPCAARLVFAGGAALQTVSECFFQRQLTIWHMIEQKTFLIQSIQEQNFVKYNSALKEYFYSYFVTYNLAPSYVNCLRKSRTTKKWMLRSTRNRFLGSMLPQYMALSVSFVSYVCQKKNLGHFEARYEVELRYADCSHKYKIN